MGKSLSRNGQARLEGRRQSARDLSKSGVMKFDNNSAAFMQGFRDGWLGVTDREVENRNAAYERGEIEALIEKRIVAREKAKQE